MNRPPITVEPKTTLRVAEKTLHDHDVSCLMVVSNERLVGVVMKLDFLEPISQLETAQKKLSIQFGVKDIDIGGMKKKNS